MRTIAPSTSALKASWDRLTPVGRPSLRKKALDFSRAEWPVLMNEADAGVELGQAGHPLFDARHADQDEPHSASVEDGPDLFEARHAEPVSFVDHHKGCRINNSCLLRFVL